MVTARYMQGNLYNSPEAALESFSLVDGLYTIQASVGGGYSANFVCWHKNPTDLRDKGLRNITINLTTLPVITAVNYLRIKDYEYDENAEKVGEIVSKAFCYPMPNFVGGTAIAMTVFSSPPSLFITASISAARMPSDPPICSSLPG